MGNAGQIDSIKEVTSMRLLELSRVVEDRPSQASLIHRVTRS